MSREPLDLDPDDARVRSLMRRSDGPVTVRPFTPAVPRPSAIPVALVGAGLLVVGMVVGTNLAAWRQEVGSPPLATGGLPAPSATHTLAATATAVPSASTEPGVPTSAGAVPAAGVLYVKAADDLTYRYDGRTGDLKAVLGYATFLEETAQGVLVIGREGDDSLLRWDGTIAGTFCGDGTVIDLARNGACAYRGADGTVTISFPRDIAGPRRLAPEGWQVGAAVWDGAGSRIAFLRNLPGDTLELRAHNALYVPGIGEPRKLYEPSTESAYVTSPEWSPDGRWITIVEFPLVSNSVAADGGKLLLIDVATSAVADLGTVIGGEGWRAWSPNGDLAFVRGGGRQTWQDKRLVVRASDGSERELAIPNESFVQLAPAWSTSGHLAFVVGPSGTDAGGAGYMDATGPGDRRGIVLAPDASAWEVRCPGGALEGIRPSADGASFLLLCREPGETPFPLSIWFVPTRTEEAIPLVRGLGQSFEGVGAGGFGFYGMHPHLTTISAWSLAAQ